MAVRSLRTFTVLPHLPDRLQALQKLAYNVWWCWNQEAIALFRRIDDDLFESVGNSPVKTLGATSQARLHELEEDEGFLAHMDRVEEALNDYMTAKSTWFHEHYPKPGNLRIAYFSAEFGLHESMPIYSGGLGVACRRSPQGGQRPGRAAGRRRPDVSRRLFPPVSECGRLAAGELPGKRFLQLAADPGVRQRTVSRS